MGNVTCPCHTCPSPAHLNKAHGIAQSTAEGTSGESRMFSACSNSTTLYDGDDGHAIKSIPGGRMRPWWVRWARVHWQAHNTNNGETWPGIKK